MKKIYLFVAAAMMSTAMFADGEWSLQVATFEDVEIAEESVMHLEKTGTFWSGTFSFTQEVSSSEYEGNVSYYYSGNVPTSKSDNAYKSYLDAEKSAKGGAYEGKNFNVWYPSYSGDDHITIENKAVVPGFFINNTAYAVNSMCNGDDYAKAFTEDDWFKLTISGKNNGTLVEQQVEVYLAKDGEYISEWTYVDLSTLGEIDKIIFSLWGSDTMISPYDGSEYLNTPAYFAMDNFGAEKPENYEEPARAEFPKHEAINSVSSAVKATKIIRDGKVVIVRGDKTFNILGAEL